MALQIEIIETFFEAKFEFADQSLSNARSLLHFDGFVHWQLFWDQETQSLWIGAGRELAVLPFPVVEVGGYYVSASVAPLTGGGTALILIPRDARDATQHLVLTKTKQGYMSLSTSVGKTLKE